MWGPPRSIIHIKNVIINEGEIQYSLLAHCHVRMSVLVISKKIVASEMEIEVNVGAEEQQQQQQQHSSLFV